MTNWSRDSDVDVPEELPDDVVAYVDKMTSIQRRALLRYVEEVESVKGSEQTSAKTSDGMEAEDSLPGPPLDCDVDNGNNGGQDANEWGEGSPSKDVPDGVPATATLTVKEINDNRYYYWQWRDGDKIRSKYKGPVADNS